MSERLFPQERHESQRGYFTAALYEEMAKNKDIWLVTFDLGYKVFDNQFADFPERTINVGAAEGGGMGIAIGLALEGKVPFVYTISSFYMRCAEQISLYIAQEQIPVKLIGGGRSDDYKHDGASHNADMIAKVMETMGVPSLYPETKEEIPQLVHDIVRSNTPVYLNLTR